MFTADKHFSNNVSVDEVLFTMVSPGPFIPTLNLDGAAVVVESSHFTSDLFHSRWNALLTQSRDVRIFIEFHSKLYEMEFAC